MHLRTLLLSSATLLALGATAHAQTETAIAGPAETPLAVDDAEAKDSINVSPLGLIFGTLALSYEHLFDGGHGLVVEASHGSSSNDDAEQSSFGGGIGYRWHWRGQQNSGFLGVMIQHGRGSGTVTIDPDGEGDEMEYDASISATTLTANIGKRWMIGDRFNVTLRIGAGYGHYTADVTSDSEGAEEAEAAMDKLLALIPVALDGELSFGLTF